MAELTAGSVQQLLAVLEHCSRNRNQGTPFPTAYHDAVRDVANRQHVTYQTIGDFRRRLGFRDIGEYLDLISRWLGGDIEPLRRRIKQHSTPGVHSLIDHFFRRGGLPAQGAMATSQYRTAAEAVPEGATPSEAHAGTEELCLLLGPETRRRLSLAHLAKIGQTLEETALALLERGFEAEKHRIREFLNATVGAT